VRAEERGITAAPAREVSRSWESFMVGWLLMLLLTIASTSFVAVGRGERRRGRGGKMTVRRAIFYFLELDRVLIPMYPGFF
jgi:hypothetical protein